MAVALMTGLVASDHAISSVTAVGLPPAGLPATGTQFDITGFLQSATLDTPGDPHSGGVLMVNNQSVIVPRETIVILPANALSWQEMFAQAPAPYGIPGNPGVTVGSPETGLAIADAPRPITTYEFHVVGNRVGDSYVAGLVNVAQQDLNSGAGYINFMDYQLGEMRVGGNFPDPNCVQSPANTVAGGPTCSGARVQINDPLNPAVGTGRYGRAMTPDQRFMVDQDNPTIAAGTGYPMCFPRTVTDPNATDANGAFVNPDDALCPRSQRALDATQPGGFASTTNSGSGINVRLGYIPNAGAQAPMEVGDYISYAGNLVNDSATPTVAVNGAATYISAHTITSNFAAYTAPGVNPAYVSIEVALIGTGGLTVFGAGEAAIRTRFEGMTTDPTRNVHLYGIDINPITGALTDRDWGMISPDPGPPNGAVEGRWRFRPPCVAPVGVPSDKKCSTIPGGSFLPVTREVRAVVDGTPSPVGNPLLAPPVQPGFVAPITAGSPVAANGIVYGQYHAPIGEYIFPENTPGNPIVPNNFEAMPFDAYGGYTSAGGTQAGQLNPWPGAVAPQQASCAIPVPGGPYTVASGGTVTLSGGATGTSPLSFTWTQPAIGTLSSTTIGNPVYTAPVVAATTVVTAALTATNLCGTSVPANATITINAPAAPTVNPIASQTVQSGANVTLIATSASPGPLSFTFTPVPAIVGFPRTIPVVNPAAGATTSFVAPVAAGVLTFSVTATNAANVVSAPVTFTITVTAVPNITLVNTYRTAKSRLVLTATTADLTAVITLQPYLTELGTTFDPTTLGNVFTNVGAGTYTITIVGAPAPACNLGGVYGTPCNQKPLSVTSNHGGFSAPTALTLIRPN